YQSPRSNRGQPVEAPQLADPLRVDRGRSGTGPGKPSQKSGVGLLLMDSAGACRSCELDERRGSVPQLAGCSGELAAANPRTHAILRGRNHDTARRRQANGACSAAHPNCDALKAEPRSLLARRS
ncbi:MAG: hypothetical protein EOS77_08770, partial [Mesorhizobium sp.]